MHSLKEIQETLGLVYPDVDYQLRQAGGGVQILNLRRGSLEIVIEWKPGNPFGLSCSSEASPLDGLFESPQEFYEKEEEVFARIDELVSSKD